MKLTLLDDRLAVCRLAPGAALPAWFEAGGAGFCSLTRTADECSLVCAEELVPAGVRCEGGWRIFRVDGTLDFALTGILLSLAEPLARAGISIFAVSTFDTDYVMVKEDRLERALSALRAAGHDC